MSKMLTLEQIYDLVPEGADYYLVAEKKRKLVCIFSAKKELYEPTGEMIDGDARIFKLFRPVEDTTGMFEEVDYEAVKEEMTGFFLEKMNPADLAREVVDTTPPGMLLDVYDRLRDETVRRRAHATSGCYAFVIPSKDPTLPDEDGKPMKLFVRG